MIIFFRRLFSILGINTIIAIIIATGSTLISMHYGWAIEIPLTIVGIAVVFPIVFSINGAYTRRESALGQYGIMKSMGRAMFFASRDRLRDNDDNALQNTEAFKRQIYNVFAHCIVFFQGKTKTHLGKKEKIIYEEFDELSKTIEHLRDRGLSGTEVARVHSCLISFITAFEVLKHIHQYRTPITLRLYSKFFIYIILLLLGPYFTLLAEGHSLLLGFVSPVIFAMVFTGLDNIQEHLENPFDQLGEDDIRINPEKFLETLIS